MIWFWISVVAVVAWYLSFTASRIDRLHHRVETSWAALDAALQRRASVAMELAISGLLDPAQSMVLTAVSHDAREAADHSRTAAEADLSATLVSLFPDEESTQFLRQQSLGEDLIEEISEANRRLEFAVASFNDAVESARIVRAKPIVRSLRLAGRATLPAPFTIRVEVPTLR